jgi:hypothetical protein
MNYGAFMDGPLASGIRFVKVENQVRSLGHVTLGPFLFDRQNRL